MKNRSVNTAIFAALTFVTTTVTSVSVAQTAPKIPASFETRYCEGCHAVDKKMVGPSMKSIAEKYKGKADSVAYLKGKVKAGGQGVWGPVPMPASTATDAEIAELVDWILKL